MGIVAHGAVLVLLGDPRRRMLAFVNFARIDL